MYPTCPVTTGYWIEIKPRKKKKKKEKERRQPNFVLINYLLEILFVNFFII